MAEQYASIIIDISHENVDRVFQYRIPPQLLGKIQVGMQVCVPFGSGNRTRTGYVMYKSRRPKFFLMKSSGRFQRISAAAMTEGTELLP